MKYNLRILIALALCLFYQQGGITAPASYYTWVDENGITNFSERDPKEYNATFVSSEARFGIQQRRQAAPQSPASYGSKGLPEDTKTSEDEQIGAEQELVRQQIAKAKQSNCEVGKRNLAKLQAFARIRVKDDEGKETMLSDEEKQQRMEQARITIRENCVNG